MGSLTDKYSISLLLVFLISLVLVSPSNGMKMYAGRGQLHYANDTTGKVKIMGVITDSRTGEQLPFANIIVSTGDSIVSVTTTNIDGRYSLAFVPVKGRKYVFRVMYLGYETVETNLVVVDKVKPRKQRSRTGIKKRSARCSIN